MTHFRVVLMLGHPMLAHGHDPGSIFLILF